MDNKKAIEILSKYVPSTNSFYMCNSVDVLQAIYIALKKLEEENNMTFEKTTWTPVNEKLPETDGIYLLYFRFHFTESIPGKAVKERSIYRMTVAFYNEEKKEWYENAEPNGFTNYIPDPIAWMSLPEAPKEEK